MNPKRKFMDRIILIHELVFDLLLNKSNIRFRLRIGLVNSTNTYLRG